MGDGILRPHAMSRMVEFNVGPSNTVTESQLQVVWCSTSNAVNSKSMFCMSRKKYWFGIVASV